jgi:ATP-dependent exoDNAse (exonuclease V) beta subunit
MEYDSVELVQDFITEEKLIRNVKELKDQPEAIAALSEEVNLLYVAVTRTKGILHIPEKLLPENQPESKSIDVLLSTLAAKQVVNHPEPYQSKWLSEKSLKKPGRKKTNRF